MQHYVCFTDLFVNLLIRLPSLVNFRGCKQYQIRKKQTVDPAAFSSDTLVDSAVTVYPIRIDYEEQWRQHTTMSVPNTNGERVT